MADTIKYHRSIAIALLLLALPAWAQAWPETLTLRQRSGENLVAFDKNINIYIGDITEGQVIIRIRELDDDGRWQPLVNSTSVRLYETVEFNHRGRTYYAQITALRNYLFGDDNADILITDRAEDLVNQKKEPPPPTTI